MTNKLNTLNLYFYVTASLLIFNNILFAQRLPDDKIDLNRVSLQERVVRHAYQKFYVFGMAGNLERNKRTRQVPDEVAVQSAIKFSLSNFRIGSVEEIMNEQMNNLITPPTGEIVQIQKTYTDIEDKRYNKRDEFAYITARWVPGQYASMADKTTSYGEMLRIEPARFSRYVSFASYEVTVFLDGRSRTYRALALFPDVNRSLKQQRPEIIDLVAGLGGMITQIFEEKRMPKGFFRPKQNNGISLNSKNSTSADAATENDANDSQGSDMDSKSNVSPKVNFANASYKKNSSIPCLLQSALFGVSCNCVGLSPEAVDWFFSGISQNDAICVPPVPIPAPIPDNGGPACAYVETNRPYTNGNGYKQGTVNHVSGKHWGTTTMSGYCQQTQDCSNTCRVFEQVDASVGDEGDLTEGIGYYHVMGTTAQEQSSQGGADQLLKCQAARGYAASACLFGYCTVTATVTIGPASVTFGGGSVWNDGFTLTNQCKNGK